MQLHDVQPNTKRQRKTRVGRGGTRGKTSGRGMKGQKARAGHRIRPEFRDALKKLPKRRGYGKNRARTVNSARVRAVPVNLSVLERVCEEGAVVTPEYLCERAVVRRRAGVPPRVKVLGTGALKKRVSVSGCEMSAAARAAIERAGGAVEGKGA